MSFLRRFFSSAVPVNMEQTKTKVQGLIKEHKVVVFSKSYCPYCNATKQTLTKLGAEYTAYELDTMSDGDAIQDALQALTNQRTVPNTFINQKHIGGNSDLQALLSSGKLKTLLQEVGAIKL